MKGNIYRSVVVILSLLLMFIMGERRLSFSQGINESLGLLGEAQSTSTEIFDKAAHMEKWLVNAAFAFGFMIVSTVSIYLINRSREYLWMVPLIFCGVASLALIIIGIGTQIGDYQTIYPFAKRLLDLTLGPIIYLGFLILLVLRKNLQP